MTLSIEEIRTRINTVYVLLIELENQYGLGKFTEIVYRPKRERLDRLLVNLLDLENRAIALKNNHPKNPRSNTCP